MDSRTKLQRWHKMIPLKPITVLKKIHDDLKDRDVNWVVVGSLGLALRGISLEPYDIDIMTDRRGAYEMQRIFSKFVTKPIALRTSEKIQSHFGSLEIDGVKVEIMGDFQIRLPDGTWESPVNLEVFKETASVEGMQVPVLSLEFEYRANLKLGRTDKAEMIRKRITSETPSGTPHGKTHRE